LDPTLIIFFGIYYNVLYLLIKNNFIGFKHDDYDPHDFNKDTKVALVFNPSKSVKNFKLKMKFPR